MLIWGHKGYQQHLGYIIINCPSCGSARPFDVLQYGKKFTLYFIPTFSYDKKQIIVCSFCGYAGEVNRDKQEEIQQMLMTGEELKRRLARAAEKIRELEKKKPVIVADLSKPSDTKKCPFCAEIIKAEATYCRFCHKDLSPQPTPRKKSFKKSTRKK